MRRFILPLFIALSSLIAGCSKPIVNQVNLMPPPDVFGDGLLNPLPDTDPMDAIPYRGMLYATDRAPGDGEGDDPFYSSDRGRLLRLGVADVTLHEVDVSWDELREMSVLKNRTDKYPIRIDGVKEYGILMDSVPGYASVEEFSQDALDGEEEFARAVDAQLERSQRKHVYVYLHGYKVLFQNPVLIATELWHFLGYDGTMIAYSWPATPSKWAYIRDLDSSEAFARNFRKFLEYLGEKTQAEEIHVIAYSAGTRMAMRAMEQLALIHDARDREEKLRRLRIGNLVLIGSDLDREIFKTYLAEGAVDIPRNINIYISKKDKALGMSRLLTRYERLGEGVRRGDLSAGTMQRLIENSDRISFIDVTRTDGADAGNGHYYFRSSPWASSDILMTLAYDLGNEERGLELHPDLPIWRFPDDYIDRLWQSLARVNPEFREAWEKRLQQ